MSAEPPWEEYMAQKREEALERMTAETVEYLDVADGRRALRLYDEYNADRRVALVEFRSLQELRQGEPMLRRQPREQSLFVLVHLAKDDHRFEASEVFWEVLEDTIIAKFAIQRRIYFALVGGKTLQESLAESDVVRR